MVKKYRSGVGLMLVNKANKVLVGQRKFTFNNDETVWQMPQGGIDEAESTQDCLKRESLEEIGTKNFTIIAETREWMSYDLPENIRKFCWDGRYIGQKQKWFLLRFDGADNEININTETPEFTAWRWISIDNLQSLNVADFKRELYTNVIAEFKFYIPLFSKIS